MSKVIFKSSQSDRVICELVPPARHDKQAAVGSVLKVKGRVRGRGLLGNVTLDDCSIAPLDESTSTPETVPQQLAAAEPEVVSEASETLSPASVPDRPRSIAKQFTAPPSAPRTMVVPGPVEQAPVVSAARYHSDNSIEPGSGSQGQVPYGFYALLVLSGAVASSILSKFFTAATRVSRPPIRENTPETRQAALQALLKTEKKK